MLIIILTQLQITDHVLYKPIIHIGILYQLITLFMPVTSNITSAVTAQMKAKLIMISRNGLIKLITNRSETSKITKVI